ncbi:FMN-dependent alpha-hydroxy acid dehydrogenase [Cylindrobasidium torrendii FP15055 ss-10]|uniref:FMN-dependent alpha-hydroxy acid dehydrogenase n=1 Tax=Cylindrobasidium torrendii FP15055 ss-10 TaxID=1314674 RepID=A0A0D7BF54_9AGAR|nr:FMN-dependent alpha-hydroxy acid dehydrogenase [Cylindrobasidium torrendii FP15055 ss-10]
MFSRTLVNAVALAAFTLRAAAQYQDMPPAMGPWFDINTQGVAGDYGEANTGVNAADEIAGWYDLADVWRTAQKVLEPSVWGRVAGGSGHEESMRWNSKIFEYVTFRPRIGRDLANATLDTSITLKNGAGVETVFTASSPIFFAPSGSHGRVNPDVAENGTVRAAATAGVIAGIAQYATVPIASLGSIKSENQTLWYQIYPGEFDRDAVLEQVSVAKNAGYTALMVTVDTASEGWQSRDWRAGGDTPSGNAQDNKLTWDDLAWLKDVQDLPVIPKGIQSVEDAVIARDMGFAAIYLSNHGGRQLDGAPAPLQVLLEINKYAPGLSDEIPILVDGGVYSAQHALKLIALGSKLVGLGRPVQFSLTMGQEGVEKMIKNLNDDMLVEMRQIGVSNPSQLNPKYVNTQRAAGFIYDGDLQ